MLVSNAGAGDLAGTVLLSDSSDPRVRARKDYSGVVVWLDPVDPASAPARAPARAKMIQKDKTFLPHVLAITTGALVDFPNYDPIFHNAFSNYDGQIFDVGLYPPSTTRSVRFSRPGIVRVFCNIHADMSAVIVVLDSPWFNVSSAGGAWSISGIPPGDYRLNVFHERATPNTLRSLSRIVAVGSEFRTLAPITISETGYLAVPHKNKYGREYPPAPENEIFYPSVRK
jgi:plastocyanin